MKKILLSLAVAIGMQAGAQTIDTVMYRYFDNGTIDTASLSKIDSIIFGYDTIWGGLGNLLLPGNATCDSHYISVDGCDGDTTITYNGYTYDLVEIGGQCWFKENLQTSIYKDGTPIDYPGTDTSIWNNDTTGAYAWYDNDSTTYDSVYGKLYNWHAVDNASGLCPTGWHVPTDCEWMYLENTLGMSTAEQESTFYRGTNEGGKFKEIGTTHWDSPNTGATNISGFSGLPGGSRDHGGYYGIGSYGYWWSSKKAIHAGFAWDRALYHYNSRVHRVRSNKEYGFSVRCLKD